ncbi:MAG: hypothetical protein J7L43_00500 [Candidatus Aenigmarchaeota archaeon]|nr:hypothetical protein [Candidatus Aenigmarchaeota archaeon]
MKKLLILLSVLLVASVGFAVFPQSQNAAPGTLHIMNKMRPVALSHLLKNKTVVDINGTKLIQIKTPEGKVNITREIVNGAKIISMSSRGVNRTMVISNETKETYITTPRAVIEISQNNENHTKEIHIIAPNTEISIVKTGNETEVENALNHTEGIERFVINPRKARISAWLRMKNMTNETAIPARLARIRARIRERVVNMTVNESKGEVEMRIGNLTVVTRRNIEIENGTVVVRTERNVTAQIKALPDDVINKIRQQVKFKKLERIEIDSEGNKVVYKVRALKPGKFLGVFNVNVPVESSADVVTGDVIHIRRPWWAFLVR